MADKVSVQVVPDEEHGLVVLSFKKAVASYAATPKEMIKLASQLIAAARKVQGGPASERSAPDDKESRFDETEDSSEEYPSEVVERMRREEKAARGGD